LSDDLWRTWPRMQHPNVATVYSHVAEGRHPLLVIEPLMGETLAQRLGQLRAPEPGRALVIAGAIASALAHAHAWDLVHGCIAPESVFLDLRSRVKVMDFGLSRLILPAGVEP